MPLVGERQHLRLPPLALGGEGDLDPPCRHQVAPGGEPQDHPEHRDDVAHRLPAEPGGQFPVHERLRILLRDVGPAAQLRHQVAPHQQAVGCVG